MEIINKCKKSTNKQLTIKQQATNKRPTSK